jgi:hypothetical protein
MRNRAKITLLAATFALSTTVFANGNYTKTSQHKAPHKQVPIKQTPKASKQKSSVNGATTPAPGAANKNNGTRMAINEQGVPANHAAKNKSSKAATTTTAVAPQTDKKDGK